MNRFLVYFSEALIQQTKAMNSILKSLNQIGSVRPADFNVSVVETPQKGSAVYNAISATAPSEGAFFVASVKEMGFRGDYQFGSTLGLFDKSTPPR